MRGPLRAFGLLAAGALVGLGFSPTSIWLAVPCGLALATILLSGRTRLGAAGYGYLFGLGLCGVSISWLSTLSLWIGLLLVAVVALFLLGYGLLVHELLRLPGWPVWVACGWMFVEFVWCRFPFGGFGWIRLGYTTIDTPLGGLLPWVGVVGAGFATALIGQLGAWAVSREPRKWLVLVVALLLTAAVGMGGRAGAVRPGALSTRTITIGFVQGNIEWRGMEMGRARVVTNNHLSETVTLMAKVKAGIVPSPDFILWPENSTDVDPLLDAQARATIEQAVATAGVPVLVGAVLAGPGQDERQTAGLWWTKEGVKQRYEKRNLVPFGEWIPGRNALLPLFPILQRVGEQSVPGTKPGAFDITLRDGSSATIGDIICFELAWDSTVFDTVRHGAQVLVVQSNNASYGGSPQISQQWTITRARAMETGRDVVVATTNSYSGLIHADGSVGYRTQEFVNDSGAWMLPLRNGLTMAVRVAPLLDWLLGLTGVGAAIISLLLRLTRGRIET